MTSCAVFGVVLYYMYEELLISLEKLKCLMRMKKYLYVLMSSILIAISAGCSNDDDQDTYDDLIGSEVNVLLIRSDNGQISKGALYKSGEVYNPPHCYLGKEIMYNDGNPLTFYHMSFGTNIKGSDVFDMLNITFTSSQPMIFSNMKAGDTFDSSQFHASAAYTPTWPEDVLIQTTALSGKLTVIGTSKVGDKSYKTLRISNLCFDAIDHSCVYSVDGTVEYEIWDIHYE